MTPSRVILGVSLVLVIGSGCRRAEQPPPPLVPQVSGTTTIPGLAAPVRVVRDRWGVPHIYAQNQDDLFFAQGFVQAQDRLFQMDLWRRSAQGRLSEVLGMLFLDRDAMTRRVQYRGDTDADWASYGPDAKAIATAFVSGINAWVVIARARQPEEFVLAGWRPELWRPEDLLNRTDAFTMSGNALAEIFRARVVAAVGPARAGVLLPLDPPAPTRVPAGLDPATITFVLGDLLRSVGTPPFFINLAAPVRTGSTTNLVPGLLARGATPAAFDSSVGPGSSRAETKNERRRLPRGGSNNWVVAGTRSATGAPLLANDPHGVLGNPSLCYVVHLNAPGWNVIGATAPWMPGVTIGHNDRVAWGVTTFQADQQDIYVEKVNPSNRHQVEDRGRWVDTRIVREAVPVSGLSNPFQFEHEFTRHGVVVGIDSERNLAFALRWTGTEPGTAAYLGALAVDRANSAAEFREALAHWKMPGGNFVYADVSGSIGYQAAALTPVRRTWNGTLPVSGWSDVHEWQGFYSLDDLPHVSSPAAEYLATANNNTLPANDRHAINYEWGRPARINRIREVFAASRTFDVEAFTRLQQDVVSWNAEQLVPLLARVRGGSAEVEQARQRLLAWDKRLTVDSSDATVYVLWERALLRNLVERKIEASLTREYIDGAADGVDVLVPAMTRPSSAWFDRDPVKARDALVVDALRAAVASAGSGQVPSTGSGQGSSSGAGQSSSTGAGVPGEGAPRWGSLHTVLFEHPLAINDAARRRFAVGPFEMPGYADTIMAMDGPGLRVERGASFRQVLDVGRWDRSVATNAPGESGSPASTHFADLAKLWAAGEYFPLSFSDGAVQANTETTLTLVPAPYPAVRR